MTILKYSVIFACIFIFFVFFTFLPFDSREHLHPVRWEEPQQVGSGRRLLLCGCEMCGHPDYPVDIYVWTGEPHYRDVAAGAVRQHHSGLQQQGSAVWQRLHVTNGPAAAGCWLLRGHCDGWDRKQQGRWPGPQSEWWVTGTFLSLAFWRFCCVSGNSESSVWWPTEVLYEDLQYLSVSAVGLAGIAGLLMVSMWLLDKAYWRIVAWRQKKQMQGKAAWLPRLVTVGMALFLSQFSFNSAENDVTELHPLWWRNKRNHTRGSSGQPRREDLPLNQLCCFNASSSR